MPVSIHSAAVTQTAEYVQHDQPEGVPPLALTGERTLPDLPEENYWYRRHLAVYEWIADRCRGLDVVDMACGEGYGTGVLAARAARVTGVDANPEAHAHARAKYTAPGVRFERDLVEGYRQDCDAVVFLQTIEHVENPAEVLGHFKSLLRPGGAVYVSTPNLLTLAPPGRREVGQSLAPQGVPARGVPRALLRGVRRGRAARPLPRAQAAAARARAEGGLGRGPRTHRHHRAFYDRFTPAIAASDFALRSRPARRGARLRRGPAMSRDRGALALVLHTHMPYVEGFGTWPFGEEWLWEAVACVYVPLLDLLGRRGAGHDRPDAGALRPARDPSGPGRRALAGFLDDTRRVVHAEDSAGLDAPASRSSRPRCAAPEATTSAPRAALAADGPDLVGALRSLAARARSSSGRRRPRTLSCRCSPPTPGCGSSWRPGAAAHQRRFGQLGGRLLAAGVRLRAGPRARAGGPRRALGLRRSDGRARARRAGTPRAGLTEAGVVAVPIDWQTVKLVWDDAPATRPPAATATTTAAPTTTCAPGASAAAPTTRPPRGAGAEHARDFVARCIARLDAYSAGAAGPACSAARSTQSCSATGGTRGRPGSRRSSAPPTRRASS